MMKGFMSAIGAEKALVIYSGNGENVARSVRNIPGARYLNVASINVYDLLNSRVGEFGQWRCPTWASND